MDHGEGIWGHREFYLPVSFHFPLPLFSPPLSCAIPRKLFIIHLLVGPAIDIGKSHLKYSFERRKRKYVALPHANLAPPPPPPQKKTQPPTSMP